MKTQRYCFNKLEMWNIIVSFKKRTYSILITQKNMNNIQLNLKGNRNFEVDYSINNTGINRIRHSKVSELVCNTVYETISNIKKYNEPTKLNRQHLNKAKLSSDLFRNIMKNIRCEL